MGFSPPIFERMSKRGEEKREKKVWLVWFVAKCATLCLRLVIRIE
jgi:hypothetical protein